MDVNSKDILKCFQKIFQRIPYSVGIYKLTGKALWYNSAFENTFGFNINTLPSLKDWIELSSTEKTIREELFNRFQCDINLIKNGNESPVSNTYNLSTYSGKLKFVEIIISIQAEYVILFFKIIPNSSETQKELLESDELMTAIFDSTPIPMLILNEKREILHLNKKAKAAINIDNANTTFGVALGCINAIHNPKGCGRSSNCSKCSVRVAISDTFQNHENQEKQEAKMIIKGKVHTLVISTSILSNNEPKRVLVTMDDITHKKEIEQNLAESEHKLKEAQKMAHLGNWEFNLKENRLIWSDEIYRIFEISHEEFNSTYEGFLEVVHPDDKERINTSYKRHIEENLLYDIRHRVLLKNGDIKFVHETCFSERDKMGNAIRSLGVVQDISDLVKNEIQLKENEFKLKKQNDEYLSINEELMQSYEELQSTNEALELANKKAVESDQLKTVFLQNISHEIRTPLNGVLGFINLFSDSSLTESQKAYYIKIINESSNQLLHIVDDIISISILETKQISLNERKIIINKLINKNISSLSEKARKKGLSINSTLKTIDSKCSVIIDETKLNQILYSLLDNAIKFTQEGEIEIGYEIIKDQIRFYVKDTGIGIHPKHHDLIFERFRQVNIEMTKTYGGNGLGLTIAKGNSEIMNGKIWVESEPHQGSIFYVLLPYKPTITNAHSTLISDNFPELTDKSIVTILIAEDEEINFLFFKEIMDKTSAYLLHAWNGQEAIDICKKNKDIDLVLMDIKMPIIDGVKALKQIKKFRPELPIIAQTAYGMPNDKNKVLKNGFNDYISKPIEKETLLKLVHKYCRIKIL